MKTYKVVSEIQAEEMDRDTAGRNGYLDYFDGSASIDKTEGYCFLNPVTMKKCWIKKDEFEAAMYDNIREK